jgi:signal transduction histidine kinase
MFRTGYRTGLTLALAAGALMTSASIVSAQQFGTEAEAKAMLERAVTEMKADSKAAIAKFGDKDNKAFRDRDLYVFCWRTSDGMFTTHPNPAVAGTDMRNLKVKDDTLGQRLFDAAKEGRVAAVDYNFPKPGTTEPVPKQSFVTLVGDNGCGVGYYK